MDRENLVSQLNADFMGIDSVDVIRALTVRFAGRVVFTTSFGIEDQVVTDMIFRHDLPVRVVTLDTGRLFEETYKVFANTRERYGKPIQAYCPDAGHLEVFISQRGPNCFYESVENRRQCCHIRKVEPLKRALASAEVWITGLRAAQSQNRHDLNLFVVDAGNEVIKYNPLLHWELNDCRAYVKQYNVPYNTMHDKGFVSIGCAPCTRAIREGEDFRAGRWWWEDNSKKECGLHTH
ncbi:MAG: phosphoadenylyl-sulfate reductase [Bacteroidales bacterium]|jgi:phosphoadenosine phosphosulfate reductase|nr:phosphoadenylyl-sulfate reductase [Bacteroidales bacterium]